MELRNTQFLRWHLGYCFCQVKRPNYYYEHAIGTLNAHASWRGCAYVRIGAWSYLLISRHYPRFSFLVKRLSSDGNECKPNNIICLTKNQKK